MIEYITQALYGYHEWKLCPNTFGTADKEVMETIELLAHFGITVKTAKEDMDEYYDALDCEENCGCEECNVDDSEIIRELDRIFRSGIISQQD